MPRGQIITLNSLNGTETTYQKMHITIYKMDNLETDNTYLISF